MLKYQASLNAHTGGRATYSMDFSTYEEVPKDQAQKVIDEQKSMKAAAVS